MAAPGLASILLAARRGEPEAIEWLGKMARQMQRAGGDMARMGAALGPLSRGERNPQRLGAGMGALGRSLLRSVLDELAKAEQQ